MAEDEKAIGVTLESDMKKKFYAIKKEIGLQKNADLVRWLISDKFKQLGLTLPLPRFEKINAGLKGVLIHDRQLEKSVDVYIRPEGITCSHHETDHCEHIDFALSLSEVQDIIRKKRKEGWKLPETE